MKSAIGILTFRRLNALQEMLRGIEQHCSHYPLAVFEDCGCRDNTTGFMSHGRKAKPSPDLLADEMVMTEAGIEAATTEEEKMLGVRKNFPRYFVGHENLGVSGNSNRLIHWFMHETDADHLCICNDDLHVLGDFVSFYGRGHTDLGVGMFCFCPSGGVYDHDSYKWALVRSRGYAVRLMPRLTGIMISVTRDLLNKIGYFDTRFGKFGNEHCDLAYRARFAGGIKLDGLDQNCLDIEHTPPLLKHQDVATSLSGPERIKADQESMTIMAEISKKYAYEPPYKPFSLKGIKHVGTYGAHGGIPFEDLPGYRVAPQLSI